MIVHVPHHNATAEFPDGMDPEEIKRVLAQKFPVRESSERPIHDDLHGAAVTGEDSLDLQETDPTVKPAVKMTVPELVKLAMERDLGQKPVFILGPTAYVIDPAGGDILEVIASILSGNDSAALGYPERPEEGGVDVAVTKQGDVVTDLEEMRHHADNGNVAWAAEGTPEEAQAYAERVASTIRGGR